MDQAAHLQELYEALRALPETVVGEILEGQLYAQPRPSALHAHVALSLGAELKGPFDHGRDGPGGWRILTEPEVHFEPERQILVPDLAGWRRERMPELPDDHRIEIVPDWVCEVLSPSTASKDREAKLPIYARFGVAHAWLVDPRRRTTEVYALADGQWRPAATFEGDAPISAPPFAARTIALAWD